jgi:hypothetical protein
MESTDDLSLDSSQNPGAISKAKKDERARKKRAYRLRKKNEASSGECVGHPMGLEMSY